ncbi:MAG: hypothetical protein LC098_05105 [Burkholderiales bacterium]|nr:hypothetical protein [Burkholderiales bacterium]
MEIAFSLSMGIFLKFQVDFCRFSGSKPVMDAPSSAKLYRMGLHHRSRGRAPSVRGGICARPRPRAVMSGQCGIEPAATSGAAAGFAAGEIMGGNMQQA